MYKILDFFRDIRNFFKNIWLFRYELKEFQPWDYGFNLIMLKRTLELTFNNLKKYSNEESSSLNKKLNKISRVVQLLEYEIDDKYIELAEKELGYKYEYDGIFSKEMKEKNSKIFKITDEIQEKSWNELWDIIKGTNDLNEIKKSKDFDGSNMRSWWD